MRFALPDKVAERLVLDGSTAVNAALVDGAFTGWEDIGLYAPTLLWSEAASGIAQMRWRGEISDHQAAAAVDRLLAAPIEFVPSRELVADATALAREFGWAKTYDAEYVVLAKRLTVPLMTLDARLAERARRYVDVVSPLDIQRQLGISG